jgi:hypothetical protein
MSDAEKKKSIRRTTLILSLVALAFFVAFITMGVMRA